MNNSSLENGWESVLEKHKHTGIAAEEFLKHAFSVSGEEWDDLKDRTNRAAVHRSQEYLSLQEDFERYSETSADDIPTPISGMVDMILNCHRSLSTQRVKVLQCTYMYDKHDHMDKMLSRKITCACRATHHSNRAAECCGPRFLLMEKCGSVEESDGRNSCEVIHQFTNRKPSLCHNMLILMMLELL